MSLGSGSSGNCYYLEAGGKALLVDAGVGIRTMRKTFNDYGLKMDNLYAIVVTHDHADHIKAVGNLSMKYGLPVYATPRVHEGMQRSYCMTKKIEKERRLLLAKEETVRIGAFEVTCFEVPHDSTDHTGYRITAEGKTFVFLTDVGHVTPTIIRYVEEAEYLVLEANYDEGMLREGRYPFHLKQRISGGSGHLSNTLMARLLAEHFPKALKHLWLCHLSKENNTPEKAMKTLADELALRGISMEERGVKATPLRRTLPSELYHL